MMEKMRMESENISKYSGRIKLYSLNMEYNMTVSHDGLWNLATKINLSKLCKKIKISSVW